MHQLEMWCNVHNLPLRLLSQCPKPTQQVIQQIPRVLHPNTNPEQRLLNRVISHRPPLDQTLHPGPDSSHGETDAAYSAAASPPPPLS